MPCLYSSPIWAPIAGLSPSEQQRNTHHDQPRLVIWAMDDFVGQEILIKEPRIAFKRGKGLERLPFPDERTASLHLGLRVMDALDVALDLVP
jgi:hypothetical protein